MSLIGLGSGYRRQALAGLMNVAGKEARREEVNEALKRAEKQERLTSTATGAGLGIMAAPKVASWLAPTVAPNATLALGAGPLTDAAAGELGATIAGAYTPAGLLGAEAVGTTAATTAATMAPTAVAGTAAGAGTGAATGAAAGSAAGPIGMIAGAALGYLISRLF